MGGVFTETMVQTSYLLNKLIRKLHWAGLYEKVEKCRALVIIKGVVSERKIEINGNPIQSIQEEPVRFLGKWYNATLNEKSQIEGIVKGVKDDLKLHYMVFKSLEVMGISMTILLEGSCGMQNCMKSGQVLKKSENSLLDVHGMLNIVRKIKC